MTAQISDQIEQFIRSYGWKFESQTNGELITRFVGETTDTNFNLIIAADEKWLSLTVWPYFPYIPTEKRTEVLDLIAKCNFQVRLARLALTASGDIAICLDLPAEALTEPVFHTCLDVITWYADSLYPEFLAFWSEV